MVCHVENEDGAVLPGYTARKSDVQKRLRRIEGQVRGLQRMVDEDQYCIDVPQAQAKVREAAAAIERLVKS